MARVHLWGELRNACDGAKVVEVDAGNVNQLITALEERFPDLRSRGLSDMTVAIDGELMSDAGYEPIGPETEIHFLQPLAGG